jgi:signal transduction histidine kinase
LNDNKQISDLKKQLKERGEAIAILQQQQQEFLSLATHDLQSPLRKLETFIDQLSHKLPENADLSSYIDRINSTVSHMRYMINSAESLVNVGVPVYETNSLSSVINEIKSEKKLTDQQITLENLPVILIGKDHLKIIFDELINNSIKFAQPGKDLKIAITSTVNTKENLLEINYIDNGLGIKTEDINSIFDPFVRLHGAKFGGAGLGLSKIKKIINIYNGTIYAIDFNESGSYFKIYLPLALETDAQSFKNQDPNSG